MAESNHKRFAVVRVDRMNDRPPKYLRDFALTGRNGLKRLAFGQRAEAHLFEEGASAEDVARRLRRRISTAEYDYCVMEISEEPAVLS